MSSKKWDDTELDRVSAELDAELEEIFAEVDRVKRRPDAEAGLPKAMVLPDDFVDEPRKSVPFDFDDPDDPPEIEILPDSFGPEDSTGESVGDFGRISPAADNEVFDADFTLENDNPRPGGSAAARTPSKRADGPDGEPGDDSKTFPSADYGDFRAESVGDLTPDEFGQLLERAMERAILSAIAKAGL